MSLKIKKKSGSSVPPMEAGTYPAVCVGIVDLGEQYNEAFKKYTDKMLFIWEIPSQTIEIDGDSMEEIVAALDKCYASKNGKPKCIYGHTVKGKGVSYMENQCGWHGVAPNKEQYEQAMAELKAQLMD